MIKGTILVVDDEKRILHLLDRVLRGDGHQVLTAQTGHEAIALIEKMEVDLMITDMKMPQMDGIELIEKTKAINQYIRAIVITAHGGIANAVEAMKAGAWDYLQKPLDLEAVKILVQKALNTHQLEAEHRYLHEEREVLYDSRQLVGNSHAMEQVKRTIELVAQTKSTTLIRGESGTGKELVAHAIHQQSAERNRPLVKVNCAAIPEGLLESELFGHVKGAFTNATGSRKGRFLLADGGTIFLDEISLMSPDMQGKLLRVLQEREIEAVGSDSTFKIDVRVVAATSCNLEEGVETGSFREDLFYRLNIIPISMPPLRERKEDIPELTEYLMNKISTRVHKTIKNIEGDAMNVLFEHNWPGNVRELENVLERAIVLTTGNSVTVENLCLSSFTRRHQSPVTSDLNLKAQIAFLERDLVAEALRETSGVKQEAAKLLGISPRSMSYYLQKYTLG